MSGLMILVGAGASYDCTSSGVIDSRLRPPLVAELFDERFRTVINRFPHVQTVSAKVRSEIARGAVPLEEFIRTRLLQSDAYHDRLQYWSLPSYLQELFKLCSADFTTHADHYDLLIDQAIRVPNVMIVTLNYDTLLDRELSKHRNLQDIEAYVGNDWSLIKLHGSINWQRDFNQGVSASSSDELIQRLADGTLSLGEGVYHSAEPHAGQGWSFPAIAVPAGPDDPFVCPAFHVDHLRTWLCARSEFSLMVVGYRCYDKTVLDLINECGPCITRLLVVNGPPIDDQSQADEAVASVVDHLGPRAPVDGRDEIETYDVGFGEFVMNQLYARFIAKCRQETTA